VHDPRDLQQGRLAIERSLISSQAAAACLDQVTREGSPFVAVALKHGLIDERQALSLGGLPQIGDRIAGDEIISLLGQGGMGIVYAAQRRDAEVAIKLILSNDTNANARFERDRTLERRGKLPVSRALKLIAKLAETLHFIHERGITHRDLKPANILIRDQDAEPLLPDFGLAAGADFESLTKTGEVLGAPAYMAPEQASSEHDKVGPASGPFLRSVSSTDSLMPSAQCLASKNLSPDSPSSTNPRFPGKEKASGTPSTEP